MFLIPSELVKASEVESELTEACWSECRQGWFQFLSPVLSYFYGRPVFEWPCKTWGCSWRVFLNPKPLLLMLLWFIEHIYWYLVSALCFLGWERLTTKAVFTCGWAGLSYHTSWNHCDLIKLYCCKADVRVRLSCVQFLIYRLTFFHTKRAREKLGFLKKKQTNEKPT